MKGYDIVVLSPSYVLLLDGQNENRGTSVSKKMIELDSTKKGSILLEGNPQAYSLTYSSGEFIEICKKKIEFTADREQYILVENFTNISHATNSNDLHDAIKDYVRLPNAGHEENLLRVVGNSFGGSCPCPDSLSGVENHETSTENGKN